MKRGYVGKRFGRYAQSVIDEANEYIEEYEGQGFRLTLRQLYYRFVAAGSIENTERSYKRIGSIVNDGRLAGLIDWEAIEDRTRFVRQNSHWDSAKQMVQGCSEQFLIDTWANQPKRVEVWIEKDALAGVLEPTCQKFDVPLLSCRGYTSQSEMWAAGQRIIGYINAGQFVTILHFGDHDPSGLDMTRDITDRLDMFIDGELAEDASDTRQFVDWEVERIALSMAQVKQHNPPPNPAKLDDSRCKGYVARYGESSWELDALPPVTLATLAENEIAARLDADKWKDAWRMIAKARRSIKEAATTICK